MEKVWLVIKFSGEYEDVWENILYAFHTNEEAIQFAKEWEAEQMKDVIDKDLFFKLIDEAINLKNRDWHKSDFEIIHELHPEYSLESLEKSDEYYYGGESNIYIKEVSFK